MDLRPSLFYSFSAGIDCKHQILTSKVGPNVEMVNAQNMSGNNLNQVLTSDGVL